MGVDMKVKAIYDSEIGNITRSEKNWKDMRKQRIRAMKKLGRVLRNIMAIPIKRRTKRQHPFDN